MNLLEASMIGMSIIRTTGAAWASATADGKLSVVEGWDLLESGLRARSYGDKTIARFDPADAMGLKAEAVAIAGAITPLLALIPGVSFAQASGASRTIMNALAEPVHKALSDGKLTLGELLSAVRVALASSPWGHKTLVKINPHDNMTSTAFAAANLLAMTATTLLTLIKDD